MRTPDILRKSHAHRSLKDYDRRTAQQDITEGLDEMIQIAHSSEGWIATDTETGDKATATFAEGKQVAIDKLTPCKPEKAKRSKRDKETEQ